MNGFAGLEVNRAELNRRAAAEYAKERERQQADERAMIETLADRGVEILMEGGYEPHVVTIKIDGKVVYEDYGECFTNDRTGGG